MVCVCVCVCVGGGGVHTGGEQIPRGFRQGKLLLLRPEVLREPPLLRTFEYHGNVGFAHHHSFVDEEGPGTLSPILKSQCPSTFTLKSHCVEYF
jgi:hypothetical protein